MIEINEKSFETLSNLLFQLERLKELFEVGPVTSDQIRNLVSAIDEGNERLQAKEEELERQIAAVESERATLQLELMKPLEKLRRENQLLRARLHQMEEAQAENIPAVFQAPPQSAVTKFVWESEETALERALSASIVTTPLPESVKKSLTKEGFLYVGELYRFYVGWISQRGREHYTQDGRVVKDFLQNTFGVARALAPFYHYRDLAAEYYNLPLPDENGVWLDDALPRWKPPYWCDYYFLVGLDVKIDHELKYLGSYLRECGLSSGCMKNGCDTFEVYHVHGAAIVPWFWAPPDDNDHSDDAKWVEHHIALAYYALETDPKEIEKVLVPLRRKADDLRTASDRIVRAEQYVYRRNLRRLAQKLDAAIVDLTKKYLA